MSHRDKTIQCRNGFIKARRSDELLTMTVEGRDTDGLSVAGVSLTLSQLDQLIVRLRDIRANWPKKEA